MKSWEKAIVAFVKKHGLVIFAVIVTAVSMYQRLAWRTVITDDVEVFILPWISELAARGGIFAMGANIPNCNYNVPYMFILAFISYIPEGIFRLYAVKAVSIIADFVCAVAAALILKEVDKTAGKLKLFLCYSFVLCSPQLLMNGALWGQCDSVYAAFALVGIWLMLKNRYTAAMIAFGVSFSFKMQFVFIIPAIIIIYAINQRFSITKLVWFVAAYFGCALPAIIQGRPIGDILGVYFGQTKTFMSLGMNYPNVWYLVTGEYETLGVYGILTAITIFMLAAIWLFYTVEQLTDKDIIALMVWSVFTCVMFLPGMHERYAFLMGVLAIIHAMYCKKAIWPAVIINAVNVPIYFKFIFVTELVPLKDLAIVMAVLYCVYTVWIVKLGSKNAETALQNTL